jgi:HEAT repeat protein
VALGCDSDPADRASEIRALARSRAPGAVAQVRRHLDDPDRGVRATALQALADLRSRGAAGAARAGLSDRAGLVRATSAKVLGELRDAGSVDVLARALVADRDWRVRHRAAEALGHMGAAAAGPFLLRASGDRVSEVRAAAVRAIARRPFGEAVPVLARRLAEDADWRVRVEAARALQAVGSPQAAAATGVGGSDPNEFVRAAVREALEALPPPPPPEPPPSPPSPP